MLSNSRWADPPKIGEQEEASSSPEKQGLSEISPLKEHEVSISPNAEETMVSPLQYKRKPVASPATQAEIQIPREHETGPLLSSAGQAADPPSTESQRRPETPPGGKTQSPPISTPQKLHTPPEDSPTQERPIRIRKTMMTARGKKCPVLVPYDDGRGTDGRPFALSPEEIGSIMGRWKAMGYDITPFDGGDAPENTDDYRAVGEAILAEKHDPADDDVVICIPDPRGWHIFTNVLKEQKLQELGVAPPVASPGLNAEGTMSPGFPMGANRFGSPGVGGLSIGTPGPSIMSASRLGSPPMSRIGTPGSILSLGAESSVHSAGPPPKPVSKHISKHSMVFPPPLPMSVLPQRTSNGIMENPMTSFKFPMMSQPAQPHLTRDTGYFDQMQQVRSRSSTQSATPAILQDKISPSDLMSTTHLPLPSNSPAPGRPGDELMDVAETPKVIPRQHVIPEETDEEVNASEPGPSRPGTIEPIEDRAPTDIPAQPQSSDSVSGRIFSRDITPPPEDRKHVPKLSKSSLNAQAASFQFNPMKSPFDPTKSAFDLPQTATMTAAPAAPVPVSLPAKPAFDPLATFKPSNFSALVATAQAFTPKRHTPSNSRQISGGSKSSFNVEAPAFQPKMQIPSGEFSFISSISTRNPSTTTFNESDYGGAGLSDTMTSVGMSSSEGPHPAKIFGNIADAFKVPKKSKPITIRRPDSPKVGLGIAAYESEEDRDGRAQRPEGRGKRARPSRSGFNDGDEVPQFAAPSEEVFSPTPSIERDEEAVPAQSTDAHSADQLAKLDDDGDSPTLRHDAADRPRSSHKQTPQSSQPSSVRRLRRPSSARPKSATIDGYPLHSRSLNGSLSAIQPTSIEAPQGSVESMAEVLNRVTSKSFRRKGIPDFDGRAPTPPQPHYMRSNAPSPSPRKIIEDRHVAHIAPSTWRATNTLRNFKSPPPGIRRLNANEEIPTSDWDDEFPDDAEDYKLHRLVVSGSELPSEAQSSPFVGGGSHIEVVLNNIQQSLAALSAQQASLASGMKRRRDPSSDLLSSAVGIQSDADDEDDSHDELRSAAWVRPKSPRRNRREDRLRAMIREAVEEGMEQDALEGIGEMQETLANMQLSDLNSRQQLAELLGAIQELGERNGKVVDMLPLNREAASPAIQTVTVTSQDELVKELRAQLDEFRQGYIAEKDLHASTKSHLEATRKHLEEERHTHSLAKAALQSQTDRYHEEKTMHANTQALHVAAEKQMQSNIEAHKELMAQSAETQRQLLQKVADMTKREALQRATVQLKTPALERSRVMVEELQKALSGSQSEVLGERAKVVALKAGHGETVKGLRDVVEGLKREKSEVEAERRKVLKREAGLQAQMMTLQAQLREQADSHSLEVSRAKSHLQIQLDSAISTHSITVAEKEMQLSDALAGAERLRLDLDAERKRGARLSDTLAKDSETGKSALVESTKQAAATKVEHFKKQLELELSTRHHLEASHAQKRDLLEEKLAQREEMITMLREQTRIAREAAQAAVQNAQAHHSTVATPRPTAGTPATSPNKQRSTRAVSGGSLRIRADSNLPSKISPQALRESILVLQEQLQQRESHIEDLEAELAAPRHPSSTGTETESAAAAEQHQQKMETEIAWLRELLEVRLDDLRTLITELDEPFPDRDALRDTAVRLRTGLEMEVAERERAVDALFPESGHGSGSSTPKPVLALRLAELGRVSGASPVAGPTLRLALGNLRKAREGGASYLGRVGSALGERIAAAGETPAKGPAGGIMGMFTPPSTRQRPGSSGSTLAVRGSTVRQPSFNGSGVKSAAQRSRLGSGASVGLGGESPSKGRNVGARRREMGEVGMMGDAERLDTGKLFGRMSEEMDGEEEELMEGGDEDLFGEESYVVDH